MANILIQLILVILIQFSKLGHLSKVSKSNRHILARLDALETRLTMETTYLRQDIKTIFDRLDEIARYDVQEDKQLRGGEHDDKCVSVMKAFIDEKVLNVQLRETVAHSERTISDLKKDVLAMRNFTEHGIAKLEKYVETVSTDIYERTGCLKEDSVLHLNMTQVIQNSTEKYAVIQQNNQHDVQDETKTNDRPESCQDTSIHGVVTIYPKFVPSGLRVFCDQKLDNGGWTVFQRRQDGSVDFFRDWNDYKNGFGNLAGEFWLGNEYVYKLTTENPRELRIDMEDFEGNTVYAKYNRFQIGSEDEHYVLRLSRYDCLSRCNGKAGDSMVKVHRKLNIHSAGMKFSTKDNDNDNDNDTEYGSCANRFKSGWWFNGCFGANLNGEYWTTPSGPWIGIVWRSWKGYHYSLKFVEMKFR